MAMTDRTPPTRAVGVHLMPVLDAVDTPRPSVIVEMDREGAIAAITEVTTLAEIVTALGADPALVVVDAPLTVPSTGGRRTIDELLGWLDTPVLPISRKRMDALYGGARGEDLTRHEGVQHHDIVETFPDLLLRLLAWERDRPAPPVDLGEFRARWLTHRPPVYRPKGSGRAKAAGILPAFHLLSTAIDFGGWAPMREGDWGAIADAAVLDAAACAHVAWRAVVADPDRSVRLDVGGADVILPCDANLAERIEVNRARLAAAHPGTLERRPPSPR